MGSRDPDPDLNSMDEYVDEDEIAIRDVVEEEMDDNDGGDDIEIKEINSKFLCPITKQIMKDPVICADGYSYERTAIEQWLKCNDKSPVTEETLSTKQVFPNQNLKQMIQEIM